MKVVVNFDLCESHGLCTQSASEIFAIDDQGFLDVKQEDPPEELRAKLEQAVRECPTGAISIEE